MFAGTQLKELVIPNDELASLELSSRPESLRYALQTLEELQTRLLSHFEFRDCGAAHHFPWIRVQDPKLCPWVHTNPGCTHADMSVAADLLWSIDLLAAINNKLNGQIIAQSDLQLLQIVLIDAYISHPDGPDLRLYHENYLQPEIDNPQKFGPELTAEVERVKEMQAAKNDLFFILANFISDRFQEILLLSDQLASLPAPILINEPETLPQLIKVKSPYITSGEIFTAPTGMDAEHLKIVIERLMSTAK